MGIVVGTDSYVTVHEATEYINTHYTATDAQRTAWGALEEADKEVFLRRATQEIDSLPFRGVKRAYSQPLAFPRCYDVNAYFDADGNVVSRDTYNDPDADKVPQSVMDAQCEEALELASPSASSQTRDALNGPVKSYSIGHMSETFKDAAAGSVEVILASAEAQAFIRPFTGGGYAVR